MAKSNGKSKSKKEAKEEAVKEPQVTIELETTKTALSNILDIVGCLVDDFAMKFDKKGATITTVDPAHVAMVGLTIPSDYFSSYKFKADVDEYKLGLNTDKLKEFLKTLSTSDTIEVKYDTKDKTIVLLSGRLRRKMAEIDITGMTEPKIPDLNLTTTVKMTNDDLRTGLVATSQVSDHIRFVTKGKTLTLIGEGDTDKVDISLDESTKVEVEGKDITSMYPMDYLMAFSKALGTKNNLVLRTSDDYPCEISFLIEKGTKSIQARYLLAPRIEAD